MTTHLDIEKRRAEFETWFSDGGTYPQAVERSGDGYKLMSAQQAWQAWEASWLAARRASLQADEGKDARRYGVLRQHVAPSEVELSMNVPHKDIPPEQAIEERIDELCDAAITAKEGKHGN